MARSAQKCPNSQRASHCDGRLSHCHHMIAENFLSKHIECSRWGSNLLWACKSSKRLEVLWTSSFYLFTHNNLTNIAVTVFAQDIWSFFTMCTSSFNLIKIKIKETVNKLFAQLIKTTYFYFHSNLRIKYWFKSLFWRI